MKFKRPEIGIDVSQPDPIISCRSVAAEATVEFYINGRRIRSCKPLASWRRKKKNKKRWGGFLIAQRERERERERNVMEEND